MMSFRLSEVKAEYYLDKIWSVDFQDNSCFRGIYIEKESKAPKQRFASKFSQAYKNYDDQLLQSEPSQAYTEPGADSDSQKRYCRKPKLI